MNIYQVILLVVLQDTELKASLLFPSRNLIVDGQGNTFEEFIVVVVGCAADHARNLKPKSYVEIL
jgi:hypothetical protein